MLLKTNRLVLREYAPDDWKPVHEYASLPEFSKYQVWGPNSPQDTKNFIAEMMKKAKEIPRQHYNFAIQLKREGCLIGGCGLHLNDQANQTADLGWAVNPKYQRRGFATEAAKACIELGFLQLRLRLIYATCDTRNIASYKVMSKLGMNQVNRMIGDRKINGNLLDSFRYEISREKFTFVSDP